MENKVTTGCLAWCAIIIILLWICCSCTPMHAQLRSDYEKGSQNYWVQMYVQENGKWVKDGEPFIAPDTLKVYKIWKQR